MKLNRSVWLAVALLVVWLILGWFLGTWMGIKAPAVWYLRAGWWFLGIAGFVGYLVLRPKDQGAPPEGASANSVREIDYNFTEASKRIQTATGNKQLNSLPAIFLLGDSAAAKTTIITQSGTEPELIAGHGMQDGAVVPTRSVNLWYARNTLFIDPAGSVVADPGARRKLFKKFLPVKFNSLLASKTPPTRSVLLTVDCDSFMQAGGANTLAAKAREYQAILGELSHELGASFPVYVLFTKADKIPYFRDFVENLNEAEVADVLGLSLPISPGGSQGAYAEKQSIRLSNAFQTIYYSLADKRPIYLAREHNPTNLSNVYEFPREFAKLKPLLVQFLTDLCRPSQLGTSPFLRGFYFSGVRPITINDVVPALQLPVEDAGFDSGATRMFNRQSRSAPIAEARQANSRRMPQWVFLRNFFPGVLLADRVGVTAAKVNVKVNFARRVLLAAAAGLGLAMALWWTVSYRNNSELVHNATEAARSVPNLPLASGQIASVDSLQRLSKVRDTLAMLNKYEQDGAPWSYRALLYKGSDIRHPLRTTYYALFRRLLLQPTQQTLTEILLKPDGYEAQGYLGYQYVYNVLKSYLITVHYADKARAWNDFSPVLLQHWKKEQQVQPEQDTQAARHFAFYADDLSNGSPYPLVAEPDKLTEVTTARAFLNRLPLEDSIYRSMLDGAGARLKPLIFNHDYPGTSDTVQNTFKVESWFTKLGYTNFQKQLSSADPLSSREEWVLGPLTQHNYDKQQILAHLRVRYDQDFIETWRKFLNATRESIPYGNYLRASSVLEKLGGPQSALMLLFCVASENTNVATPEITQAFQPIHQIAPAGCLPQMQLISPLVNPYAAGLGNLSIALKGIGPIGNPNEAAAGNARGAVTNAQSAENALQLTFRPDPSDQRGLVLNKSEALLKDPIEGVPPTLDGINGAALNGQAGATCAAINPLFHKYPFNPGSKDDATLQEVNQVLNPQSGTLWKFVDGPLAPFVQKVGTDYAATTGQTAKVTPGFLAFINHASRLSQALYHGDPSGNPTLTFTMTALPAPDVDHVTLTINGSALSDAPKNKPAKTFTWPGTGQQSASLEARFGGSTTDSSVINRSGLWAIWHVLERAEHGADNSLGWTIRTAEEGPVMMNGHPQTVKFSLDPLSAQILRPQFFGNLNCSGKAVQ